MRIRRMSHLCLHLVLHHAYPKSQQHDLHQPHRLPHVDHLIKAYKHMKHAFKSRQR